MLGRRVEEGLGMGGGILVEQGMGEVLWTNSIGLGVLAASLAQDSSTNPCRFDSGNNGASTFPTSAR